MEESENVEHADNVLELSELERRLFASFAMKQRERFTNPYFLTEQETDQQKADRWVKADRWKTIYEAIRSGWCIR